MHCMISWVVEHEDNSAEDPHNETVLADVTKIEATSWTKSSRLLKPT